MSIYLSKIFAIIQPYKYTNNHLIAHFKQVDCMAYKWYLNKAVACFPLSYNKLPQTYWLKQHTLTILQSGGRKSQVDQYQSVGRTWFLWDALEADLFLSFSRS